MSRCPMRWYIIDHTSLPGCDGLYLLLQVVRPVPRHLKVRPDHPVRRPLPLLLLLLLRLRPGLLPAGRVPFLCVGVWFD